MLFSANVKGSCSKMKTTLLSLVNSGINQLGIILKNGDITIESNVVWSIFIRYIKNLSPDRETGNELNKKLQIQVRTFCFKVYNKSNHALQENHKENKQFFQVLNLETIPGSVLKLCTNRNGEFY